jgi:hypothetical protein
VKEVKDGLLETYLPTSGMERQVEPEFSKAATVSERVEAKLSEIRTTHPLTGGQKGVKPQRLDLIPVYPLLEVAKLYGYGAEKYADRNWEKGYEWGKSFAALLRHVLAWWDGEDNDPEHGLSHLTAVVFHAFALMEWSQTHPELDDRPRKD